MLAKKLMKINLQIELFLSETTVPNSKFLINKLDREDGLRSVERRCFLDASQSRHQLLWGRGDEQPNQPRISTLPNRL